jgi:hypothetical protein
VSGVTNGLKCARSFREFLPASEIVPVESQDLTAMINRVFQGNWPDYTCLLAEEWRFDEIERDAMKRVGHEFEGRKHGSIAEIVLKSLYDFEDSLSRFHAYASCVAIAQFWTSWNLQRHLAEFTERLKESPTALSLSNEPRSGTRAAREHLNVQLAVYAHQIVSVSHLNAPAVTSRVAVARLPSRAELQRLKSSLAALDSLDTILRDDMVGISNYEVPMQLWVAAKSIFDSLSSDVSTPTSEFAFYAQPNVLRAQIFAVRTELQLKIDVLERTELGGVPPPNANTPSIEENVGLTKRASSTVSSFAAAKRMQDYMDAQGLGQTAFAIMAETTDRTIRSFKAKGKVRKDVFGRIARAMGLTTAELLGENRKVTGR